MQVLNQGRDGLIKIGRILFEELEITTMPDPETVTRGYAARAEIVRLVAGQRCGIT